LLKEVTTNIGLAGEKTPWFIVIVQTGRSCVEHSGKVEGFLFFLLEVEGIARLEIF
jgi:hypothetical protein